MHLLKTIWLKAGKYVACVICFCIFRRLCRLINNIKPEPVGFESSYVLADPSGSHIAVMDREDNYVTMVTSLNTWFGSRVMTESNGILFNNAMANFWIPSADDEGSEDEGSANRLAHGQRPLMSGLVAMGLNQEQICGQRLVIGGADLASVAQVRFLREHILYSKTASILILPVVVLVSADSFSRDVVLKKVSFHILFIFGKPF